MGDVTCVVMRSSQGASNAVPCVERIATITQRIYVGYRCTLVDIALFSRLAHLRTQLSSVRPLRDVLRRWLVTPHEGHTLVRSGLTSILAQRLSLCHSSFILYQPLLTICRYPCRDRKRQHTVGGVVNTMVNVNEYIARRQERKNFHEIGVLPPLVGEVLFLHYKWAVSLSLSISVRNVSVFRFIVVFMVVLG